MFGDLLGHSMKRPPQFSGARLCFRLEFYQRAALTSHHVNLSVNHNRQMHGY